MAVAASSADSASRVLSYDPTGMEMHRVDDVPISSFHAWDEARAEADAIAVAWQHEPISLAWTRVHLGRFIKHKTMPTRGARGLALVYVAMHDAYSLASDRGLDRNGRRLAMSMAAADVLSYLYPMEERAFERIVFELAARMDDSDVESLGTEVRAAMGFGRAVAVAVIQRGEEDGAQHGWNGARLQYYSQGRRYAPGSWEPTPPYFYYPPDEPFAPGWKTWALTSGAELRMAPPAFGSRAFLDALEEVISINHEIWATTPPEAAGGTLSLSPTDPRFAVAKFWVDGHGTVTPPGRWNRIAMEEVLSSDLDDAVTLRLFAQLNIALADAFVACWDAKYHYWTMRPITAAKLIHDIDLKPLVLTPPFPSYPSGHATFSAAAAQVLSFHFPGRRVQLEAMATEAADSRLYGAIHYSYDNGDGLTMGKRVAQKVLERFPLEE